MEVTYTLTIDDSLRLAELLYRRSPQARRAKRNSSLIASLIFAGWAAYYYWQVREVDWLFIFIGGQAISSVVILPRTFDRLSLKATYRQFILKPEQADTGLHRLIIEPESVTELAVDRETRRRWEQIQNVEETDSHLYLFDTPKSAIIIPRNAFNDGRVYEELRRKIMEYAPKKAG